MGGFYSLVRVSVVAALKEQRCALTAENGQGQTEREGNNRKAVKRNVLEVCTVPHLNSSISIGQFM